MKKFLHSLMMVVAVFMATGAHAEAQLGKDYTLLDPAQNTSTKKIEVLEFFFYECGHCFHLHPFLAKWEKSKPADVEIDFVPTIFRQSAEPMATAYYALEAMGKSHQLDEDIYKAIHVDQVALYDLDTISTFMAKKGVDKNEFSSAYQSFSVQSRVARAKQLIRSYNIQGTPTLVVDGRYVITGMQPADTIRALNEVIAKVRKERAGKKR